MLIFLFYILEWFAFILLLTVFALLVIWMVSGYRSKVPFISVPNSVLKPIYEALDMRDDSVVYDLGCGEGRVLFYLSQVVPTARYIGIENSQFPLILARVRAWWYQKTTGTEIEIINQDFFHHNLSHATHIFVYLYPTVMDDLLPKFDTELKPGTKLVSASFKFTTKQPLYEIDLKRSPYKLVHTLYVYEF